MSTLQEQWGAVDPLAANAGLLTEPIRTSGLFTAGINNLSEANPNFLPNDDALTFQEYFNNFTYGNIRIDRMNVVPRVTLGSPTINFAAPMINLATSQDISVDINQELKVEWTVNRNNNYRTGNPNLQLRGTLPRNLSAFAERLSQYINEMLKGALIYAIGSPSDNFFASSAYTNLDAALNLLDQVTETSDNTHNRVIVMGVNTYWKYRQLNVINTHDATQVGAAAMNIFGKGMGGAYVEDMGMGNTANIRGIPIIIDKTLTVGHTAGYLETPANFTAASVTTTVNNEGNTTITVARAQGAANSYKINNGDIIYFGTSSAARYRYRVCNVDGYEGDANNSANDTLTVTVSRPIVSGTVTGQMNILGQASGATDETANAYDIFYVLDRTAFIAATRIVPATETTLDMLDQAKAAGRSTLAPITDLSFRNPEYNLPIPMMSPDGSYAFNLSVQSDRSGYGDHLTISALVGRGMVDSRKGIICIDQRNSVIPNYVAVSSPTAALP